MQRARGGRGRGRGRGETSPTAVTSVADGSEPRTALEALKAGLAQALEDVDREDGAFVAMVCSGIDGQGGVDYWPSREEARVVVELLFELPEEERVAEDHADHVTGQRDAQRSRLAEVREGGIIAALGPWERDLDDKPEEAFQVLLASLEASRETVPGDCSLPSRRPQSDESVAENLVAGKEDASGEVQGTQKQPQDIDEVQGTRNQPPGDDEGDEDDAAWMEQPAEDLKEKPESASGSAAPYQPAPHEYIDVGEEDASGEVQGAQNQPPGDDAAWMEQLVEDLREQPEPANENAAPYQPAPHEYIDVGGGYMMERDAYDYMQYDLTMFTAYYGLPLRMWPWDDDSFPWGAPPPPE